MKCPICDGCGRYIVNKSCLNCVYCNRYTDVPFFECNCESVEGVVNTKHAEEIASECDNYEERD